MLKKVLINLLVAFVVIQSCGLTPAAAVVTIATFADPADDGGTPLFTVDLVGELITGGWDGLTLEIPYSGNTYTDVLFTMTGVTYTGGLNGDETGGGTIKFFGSDPINPLIQIDFDSGYLSPFGFGATDMFTFRTDGVTISGSEIGGSLVGGSFAFSFGNQAPYNGDWNNGYTATASFTSSAIPEPATIILLGTAGIWVFRRKKA